jgi:hypothetical protein
MGAIIELYYCQAFLVSVMAHLSLSRPGESTQVRRRVCDCESRGIFVDGLLFAAGAKVRWRW